MPETPVWFLGLEDPRARLPTPVFLGFPGGSAGEESACDAGGLGPIPGWGRPPGEGNGYPLQCSGLASQRVGLHWVTFTSLSVTMKRSLLISWCRGFPGGVVGAHLPVQERNPKKMGSSPGSGKSPGEGTGNPLQHFLPRKFDGQRSLEGWSPWDCRVGDDRATKHTHTQLPGIFTSGREETVAKRENSALRLLGWKFQLHL